jgi:hypothetical protein
MNPYENAIVRNADWFIARQTREGFIDAEGDEFYGVRGDATLVGHSASARMYAYALTGSNVYLESARQSLEWLAARQDAKGGWKGYSAFTLDGAQCVFEGFNTYQKISGDRQFQDVLVKAADRMIAGTLSVHGGLKLPDVIEVGEYAHFAMLAWKTTGEERFKRAGLAMIGHIERNFDEAEGYWKPFDASQVRYDLPARLVRPVLRSSILYLPLRGRIIAKLSEHLLSFVVAKSFAQYSMSLMDAEALLDTLDGSCSFPRLREQTRAAISWAERHCAGSFPGSLVESSDIGSRAPVYPLTVINGTRIAALWPTTCLLIAYCGMNEEVYRERAQRTADWIVSVQDNEGGFHNFQEPDGAMKPLQSENVNFSAAMALWLFNEVYGGGAVKLFTA